MTFVGPDCPECGAEALSPPDAMGNYEIGDMVPVVCQRCGHRTEGTRLALEDVKTCDNCHELYEGDPLAMTLSIDDGDEEVAIDVETCSEECLKNIRLDEVRYDILVRMSA